MDDLLPGVTLSQLTHPTALDEATSELLSLMELCGPGQASAAQYRTLVRLKAQVQRADNPLITDARSLLEGALLARAAHPTARHPAWRALYLQLFQHALKSGVSVPDVMRLYRTQQLQDDLSGLPRHHGERLVTEREGELAFHPDVQSELPGGARRLSN